MGSSRAVPARLPRPAILPRTRPTLRRSPSISLCSPAYPSRAWPNTHLHRRRLGSRKLGKAQAKSCSYLNPGSVVESWSYGNSNLVAVLLAAPVGGTPHPTPESDEVAWFDPANLPD